ncbi:MAG: AAA domain-containing protein [Thermomicrobiales bacterium]|nr:AAA domain-containing protein [Thermomicrobiales bacterium]
MTEPCLPPLDDGSPRTIAPTDIARFARLNQCERYLRFRLHEREHGSGFLNDYGVRAQTIPLLFPRSGQEFEDRIEREAAAVLPTHNFRPPQTRGLAWTDNNAEVVELARTLPAGETLLLFQPRLQADVKGWRMRGAADLLRMTRDERGRLSVIIADMKSTRATKIDHRLQVAFYHEMLSAIFRDAGVDLAGIELAILYRGPSSPDPALTEAELDALDQQRHEANELFGTSDGFLEIVLDPQHYIGAVEDLVTSEHSVARRVAALPFEDVPFHIGRQCDSCIFNEYCMKWSHEHSDLSGIPHLTMNDKKALQQIGIRSVDDLAALKVPLDGDSRTLVPAPGSERLAELASTTWPVGPRLDEMILRARNYRSRWSKDIDRPPSFIPNKGYGSLPASSPEQHANLVRIYVDAQGDYLHDRVYMLGALVVGAEDGEEQEERRRVIVRITDGPPDTEAAEQRLLVDWISAVLRAVVEVAAPDANGELRAPIHLIFWDSLSQTLLLDGLARHFRSVIDATALYDFMTQMAGYDSAISSFLSDEIRQHRNYPFVCQSLQSVAAWLGFNWNEPEPYRSIFRNRLFDYWGRFNQEDDTSWYMNRARFNSQIPLEYAYGAWDDLPTDSAGWEAKRYRAVVPAQVIGFEQRRLEALEHIAHDLPANRDTTKSSFLLPELHTIEGKAHTLAAALKEFVSIERFVELANWRAERAPAPEKRVLSGVTLVVRYVAADQEPEVRITIAENNRRAVLRDKLYSEAQALAEPGEAVKLTSEQNKATKLTLEGVRVRFRVEVEDTDCGLDEALTLAGLRTGATVLINARTEIDSRPESNNREYTPTAKTMLYAMRGRLAGISVQRNADDRAVAAWALVDLEEGNRRGTDGFIFTTMLARKRGFDDGRLYTLDGDPNDWSGSHSMGLIGAIEDGGHNTLYTWLDGDLPEAANWPATAQAGQRRFVDGLIALHDAGLLADFEPSKLEYMRDHGCDPVLIVQGPPGTGKSYSTAFAVLARMQGAMEAGMTYRVAVSCHTHAAVDVLLGKLAEVQQQLDEIIAGHPGIASEYFHPDITSVPLLRFAGNDEPPASVRQIPPADNRNYRGPKNWNQVADNGYCVVGATPVGFRRLVVEKFQTKNLCGQTLYQCLIIDEASQMNLPLAMIAALALAPDGQLIAVGDHRQMPPIVKHDWSRERRRTFQEYRTYASLFETLQELDVPTIRFSRSFRLPRDVAEFLRREIYSRDNIDFHSNETATLPEMDGLEGLAAAVLHPDYPIIVVVHGEDRSQLRNEFEQTLITPLLETLADRYNLDCRTGLGVVVPHRAQRAGLQEALPVLSERDDDGIITRSAVDTVERFQGDERKVIVYSATESDPQYLVTASKFLMDPRRLTVALSRARRKVIVVAARTVFGIFSSDEETFDNAQLWKNLLRRECTELIWSGAVDGTDVQVWGSGRPEDEINRNDNRAAANQS